MPTGPLRERLEGRLQYQRVKRAFQGSSCVSPSLRYFTAEALKRRHGQAYRLRESGLTLRLRHPERDELVLHEVWHRKIYEPPPHVASAVANRAVSIVDLGGHVGLASAFFLHRFPMSTMTTVEADPEHADMVAWAIARNQLEARWSVVHACAASADGTRRFVSDDASSRVVGADAPGSIAVPALDVFPLLQRADLIKIDIQGGEWELLLDPRLEGLSSAACVIEFHPEGCPSADPERLVRERFAAAGLETGPLTGRYQGEGTLWAWRPI